MLELLRAFFTYNTWATERLLDTLGQLSDAQLDAEGCCAHGSIRQTLSHLLDVQWGWTGWFDGSMTVEQSRALSLDPADTATIAAARERWRAIDAQTWRFLDDLTDERLAAVSEVDLPEGKSQTPRLWQMLLHLANHGTHTRAQIVAAVRRAGVDPGSVELINWAMHG